MLPVESLAQLGGLLTCTCALRHISLAVSLQVQGDMERAAGLPVSPMCDRTKATMPQSQLNFIEFVVAPLYVQASSLYCIPHDCLLVEAACLLFWPWLCFA